MAVSTIVSRSAIPGANLVQEGRAFGRVFLLKSLDKEGLFVHGGRSHVSRGFRLPIYNATIGSKVRTEFDRILANPCRVALAHVAQVVVNK